MLKREEIQRGKTTRLLGWSEAGWQELIYRLRVTRMGQRSGVCTELRLKRPFGGAQNFVAFWAIAQMLKNFPRYARGKSAFQIIANQTNGRTAIHGSNSLLGRKQWSKPPTNRVERGFADQVTSFQRVSASLWFYRPITMVLEPRETTWVAVVCEIFTLPQQNDPGEARGERSPVLRPRDCHVFQLGNPVGQWRVRAEEPRHHRACAEGLHDKKR